MLKPIRGLTISPPLNIFAHYKFSKLWLISPELTPMNRKLKARGSRLEARSLNRDINKLRVKMAALHNRISRKELKERIQNDPTPRITISFYCYFKIEEPRL